MVPQIVWIDEKYVIAFPSKLQLLPGC